MFLRSMNENNDENTFENSLEEERKASIILYNDDVNSFDFVIETLIEVCEHHPEQAEQCAWITHYKGECQIKTGKRQEIYQIYKDLLEKGLIVAIY